MLRVLFGCLVGYLIGRTVTETKDNFILVTKDKNTEGKTVVTIDLTPYYNIKDVIKVTRDMDVDFQKEQAAYLSNQPEDDKEELYN